MKSMQSEEAGFLSSDRFACIEYNKTNSSWHFEPKWSVTHKIIYGPQLRFGPYNILWVTSRSINCHTALSAMNYLLIINMHSYQDLNLILNMTGQD